MLILYACHYLTGVSFLIYPLFGYNLQFYEELVDGKTVGQTCRTIPSKPLNKIIKFQDSDTSSDEAECPGNEDPVADKPEEECKDPETAKPEEESDVPEDDIHEDKIKDPETAKPEEESDVPEDDQHEDKSKDPEDDKHQEEREDTEAIECEESEDKPGKKQRTSAFAKDQTVKERHIDELIEEELREMGDRKKVPFFTEIV